MYKIRGFLGIWIIFRKTEARDLWSRQSNFSDASLYFGSFIIETVYKIIYKKREGCWKVLTNFIECVLASDHEPLCLLWHLRDQPTSLFNVPTSIVDFIQKQNLHKTKFAKRGKHFSKVSEITTNKFCNESIK